MDKTEEAVARDKAAIDAMKNAKSNMSIALDRITHLERTLSAAISALKQAKEDISPKVFCYKMDNHNQQTVHARIDRQIADASAAL